MNAALIMLNIRVFCTKCIFSLLESDFLLGSFHCSIRRFLVFSPHIHFHFIFFLTSRMSLKSAKGGPDSRPSSAGR